MKVGYMATLKVVLFTSAEFEAGFAKNAGSG